MNATALIQTNFSYGKEDYHFHLKYALSLDLFHHL